MAYDPSIPWQAQESSGRYAYMAEQARLRGENEALQNQLRTAYGQSPTYRGLGFNRGAYPLTGADTSTLDAYGQAAQKVIAGSQEAEELLAGAYEGLFTTRAQGINAQRQEFERGMSALARSQGYSQSVVDLLGQQYGLQTQGDIFGARAQSRAGLGMDLAQLTKGTATELAGIDQAVARALLESRLGKLSADAAKDAADKDLFGGIIGGALSALPFF